MNRYERTFRRIAEEVEVLDRTRFRHARLGTLRPAREMKTDGDCPVLPHLWRVLYLDYYAGDEDAARIVVEGARMVRGLAEREDVDLVERLREANTGRGYVEPGWHVTGLCNGHVRVSREGVTLTARHGGRRPRAPGGRRDTVGVRFPPELRCAYPGWYLAVGDRRVRAVRPVHRLPAPLRLGAAPRRAG